MCILCCNCCNPTTNTTNELTINATSSYPLTLSLIKMRQRGRGPKSKNSSWWTLLFRPVAFWHWYLFDLSQANCKETYHADAQKGGRPGLRVVCKLLALARQASSACSSPTPGDVWSFGVMSRISPMKPRKMPPKYSLQMFRPLPVTVRHLDTRRMLGSMELVKVGQVPSFRMKKLNGSGFLFADLHLPTEEDFAKSKPIKSIAG